MQATRLLVHLQRVTQDLAALRQPDAVSGIVLRDVLEALGGLGGTVLLVQGDHLTVAARRGQTDDSVWQDRSLEGPGPSVDALRTNTPLYFEHAGTLGPPTRTSKAAQAVWPPWPARCCPWWKVAAHWA